MNAESEYNATIVRRKELHDGLFFLWVEPDSGEYPEFEPGQFVSIGHVDESAGSGERTLITRTYSIGSSARLRSALELLIVHVDDGEFTSWLGERPTGSRLWLSSEASGGFTLDGVRRDKDLVLVSTGTGIAPYLSMYRTLRDDPFWRRIVLINGVRLAADLGYRTELEQAAAADPNLFYIPLVTRESAGSDWTGRRGRVDTVLEPGVYREITGAPLSPQECHVFLCGNPGMVDSLEAELTARGFSRHQEGSPGTLHLEKYWGENG